MIAEPGIIIGAGIAGVATSIAFALKGQRVQVFEARDELIQTDHLLWIAPNGLAALERLGVLDEVLKAATPQELMGFATADLRPVMTLSGAALALKLNQPIVAVRRRDLMDILLRRLYQLGGKIHFGHEVTHISDDLGIVTVSFANGLRARAPFVIGADGIGSRVRGFVDGDARVRYQGLRTWLGYSDVPDAQRYIGKTFELWGDATRFVLTSLDGKRIYWSALERFPRYESPLEQDVNLVIERLRRDFDRYHSDVKEALREADASSLKLCNFGVVEQLSRNHHGRLLLIGDASHGMPPNMGQGASLAIEDAMWVAALVNESPDLSTAWTRFENARRARVKEMTRLANVMNTVFQPESRLAGRIRDVVAKLIPDRLTTQRMIQLYTQSLPE